MSALLTLVSPGDGVLIPNPGWTGYYMMADNLGAEVLPYRLPADCDYAPDLDELEALARRSNAKVMILNSPANPTGAVSSRESLTAMLEIASRHDLFVLSDEAYDEIILDGEHISPARLDNDGRVISVFSFSEAYSMTGWRIGYATAAPSVLQPMTRVQENVIGCATAVSQRAAEAALAGSRQPIHDACSEYRLRLQAVETALDGSSLTAVTPRGAFYLFIDVRTVTEDSDVFAQQLVREAGVAVAPGPTFGSNGQGFLRVSLTTNEAALAEACRRIIAYCDGNRVPIGWGRAAWHVSSKR